MMADKIRKGAEKTKEVATSVGETLKNMGGEGETRRMNYRSLMLVLVLGYLKFRR